MSEGLNPLRPYYIPPSAGVSSSSNSTPPDIVSPSSSQVFKGSARDLLPDLDYSDYLDSSPSFSEWVRDSLDRALWRYINTLTAQPFDVAKTILQAYAVPDADDRRGTPGGRGSSPRAHDVYEEV